MDAIDMMKRARSFEHGADDYERLRPDFPTQLFDDIRTAAGARLDGRVLEVGAGTGRATLPLVRGGAMVEVVEPSKDLRELGETPGVCQRAVRPRGLTVSNGRRRPHLMNGLSLALPGACETSTVHSPVP
ncbi:MAG TPA: hypothetical protein VFK66_05775 [Oryzihumus sp.]|nr:hypothetical protein [Oryzihumus sp.]